MTKDQIKMILHTSQSGREIADALKNYFHSLPKISPVTIESPIDKTVEIAQTIFGVNDRGPAVV